MPRLLTKLPTRLISFMFVLVAVAFPVCRAGASLDSTRYIGLDEIRPGMEAYCLTVYKGAEVESFRLEVLDVIRNALPGLAAPGRNIVLVQGTDERFIHTGPVGGCSGSPVYIDGRLAGALSFAFTFSKDPLYGVTPIEEMLRVGSATTRPQPGFVFDFSAPLDFVEIDNRLCDWQNWNLAGSSVIHTGSASFEPLPTPLVTSGLPGDIVGQLDSFVRPWGFMAVSGSLPRLAVGPSAPALAPTDKNEHKLVPGACLAVPLVAGDITIDAIGTVTEVVDDMVYGFGHSFLGYGSVNFPMATGRVHAVVSNLFRSFKYASAGQIVGALTVDESTAVRGTIGARPRTIPLTITVTRYNDTQKRVYNCQIADNRLITPVMLRYTLTGAALMLGGLPPDHSVEYKMNIALAGADSIAFRNISTGSGLADLLAEGAGSVAILMNNPYKSLDIESIEVDINVTADNVIAHIWSADLSDTTVEPGEEVQIEVVVESFMARKEKYRCRLKVPTQAKPGKYKLQVCGGKGYLQFLRKAAPYRFIPENLPGLIDAMNNILHVKRDALYCILLLPPGGIAVEKAELPDLPPTKILLLQDAKRTLDTKPYQHWVEKTFRTGTVVADQKLLQITVEK